MSDVPGKHLHCPHCGYDLTGLTEPRCPECGGVFDRAELLRLQSSPRLTFGKALFRTLWVPAVSILVGAVVMGVLASAGKNPQVGVATGIVLVGSLLVAAVYTSRKLARALATERAMALGISAFDRDNRFFFLKTAVGLFCCQGILAAAGFFGGCACVLMANL